MKKWSLTDGKERKRKEEKGKIEKKIYTGTKNWRSAKRNKYKRMRKEGKGMEEKRKM